MPEIAEQLHSSVGFTGTRGFITDEQRVNVRACLTELFVKFGVREFHHGDCIGADDVANQIARSLGYKTVSHPPTISAKRAYSESDEVLPPRPYLDRNKDIVQASSVLLAVPHTNNEVLRSGTWATIRYARSLDRPIMLLTPNGDTIVEGWWLLNG